MPNINYLRTAGSCIGAYFKKEGVRSLLLLKLSEGADVLTIAQSISLTIFHGSKPIMNDGIAVLLSTNGGAFISDAVNDKEKNGFLKIPLSIDMPQEKYQWQHKMTLHYSSGGRKVSSLPIKIEKVHDEQ